MVDVSAAWTEYTDAEATLTADDVTAPGRAVLAPLAVGLDAERLASVHHEFGDTRHRLVTYTLVAHSRFRDFFAADEDPAAFVRRGELAAVHVPNTVRPTPPRVASVTPSWTLTRTASEPPVEGDPPPAGEWRSMQRSGGWLRVELAAPWWSTGEGEQLGVLLRPDDPATGTCLWRDPLVGGTGPALVEAATLEGAAGEPFATTDAATGATGVVVPFDVTLVGGRRIADIGLGAAAAAAGGMARLVLVRFQRHSLPGLEVSEPVVTDLVTVLPEREVRLERQTELVVEPTVTVTGPLGGPVELRVESAPSGADSAGLTGLSPDAAAWVVDARIETAVGTATSVPWPASGRRQRIVVREFADVQAGVLRGGADALDTDAARPLRFAAVLGW